MTFGKKSNYKIQKVQKQKVKSEKIKSRKRKMTFIKKFNYKM